MIAAIIGILSLFTPWVQFTASFGSASASQGESPAQFIAGVFTPASAPPPTDPAILAWARSAIIGTWAMFIGIVLFGEGCLLALLQVWIRYRLGGIVMVIGGGMGGAGIASFSATFLTSQGVRLSVGPAYGLAISILASLVGLAVVFLRAPSLGPPTPSMPYACPMCGEPRGIGAKVCGRCGQPFLPLPDQGPPGPPLGEGPGSVPDLAAPPGTRSCPTCGQWYPRDHTLCPKDGTELRPVAPEQVACPRCGAPVRLSDRFCPNCGLQGRA